MWRSAGALGSRRWSRWPDAWLLFWWSRRLSCSGTFVRKAVPLRSQPKPWRHLAGASISSSTTPVVRGPSQAKQTMRSGTEGIIGFLAARRLTDLIVWDELRAGSDRQAHPRRTGCAKAQRRGARQSSSCQLVPTLSSELGAHGITVNTIAPGRINSAQILKLHPTEQSRAEFIKQNIPAGYFGEPHDIGHLVAFLASPLARYINGAAIPGRWRGGARRA